MKIDLFYYTPYLNDYYFVYGPEKDTNGDIYIKGTGYYFADVNDMKAKLNSMTASLAPEITNVQPRTQGNSFWIYVGDLNTSSSDVPDYTSILNSIDNDLKNIAFCFTSNISTPANVYNNSLIQGIGKLMYCFSSNISNNANVYNTSLLNSLNSKLTSIDNKLKQSISPEVSITDVISSLNTNIHNDLTELNTTTNNKDTVLIIDGQQEFKLHKDDE